MRKACPCVGPSSVDGPPDSIHEANYGSLGTTDARQANFAIRLFQPTEDNLLAPAAGLISISTTEELRVTKSAHASRREKM